MKQPLSQRKASHDILGVGISPIDMSEALATICEWIRLRKRNYVCVTGVHGVMECRRNSRLRDIHNRAGMVTPDGMPLVWFMRLCGRKHVDRVYGPDLMRALTALSVARGYRHFYYGGGPGLADALAAKLTSDHPGLVVAGTLAPPFRTMTEAEDAAAVATINKARPDIVWIGLSTPKQEIWMAEHIDRLDAPVIIGVGAAFDYLAGTKVQAPRAMQRSGLEWLFRLATEPRRLWRRYGYIVPGFLVLASADLGWRCLRSALPSPIRRTAD